MVKVYEWTCKCDKTIVSLYEKQFDQMKAMHELTHKAKQKRGM